MNPKDYDFRLSAEESDYLARLASSDRLIASLINQQLIGRAPGRFALRLSLAQAEELRGLLTIQLAQSGFDADYSPNEDGRMLENLIDRFFVG